MRGRGRTICHCDRDDDRYDSLLGLMRGCAWTVSISLVFMALVATSGILVLSVTTPQARMRNVANPPLVVSMTHIYSETAEQHKTADAVERRCRAMRYGSYATQGLFSKTASIISARNSALKEILPQHFGLGDESCASRPGGPMRPGKLPSKPRVHQLCGLLPPPSRFARLTYATIH